ncbi:RHS repeat-associated core domain-containing protein [Candidatus Dojkabacteria bacterium]|uniref:RHS repeat-associated core domain-containing protein n=1 Tax=Candidatus Dojkabacteria bacterium TaxID=2099670 RepID=A0A955RHY7_9BACT|nr:RHS repeat-associated core domain-containing protein [Candidatus Dojkabacteria bacterium]
MSSTDVSTLPVADTYTGQKIDSELDLMYYNARYYDPVRGRFIQADSVNDGLNRYMYVSGNPVNANDPSGNKLKEQDKELEDYIKHQDYIDTGIWGFARAFSTWDGNGESSQAACEWTDLCNNSNFTGWSTLSNSLFRHAEEARIIYSEFYDKTLFAQDELTIQPYYQQEGHQIETRWFSAYDYFPINNSQLTDINIALIITISAVENPETEGRIFTRSYVGEDAINYSVNKRSSSIINTLTYSDNTLANLSVTLRAYQGTYNGGGEFSALSLDRSTPNMEVLRHYNASPEWRRRVFDIYSSIYNFATRNEEEYGWLKDNILIN